MGNHVVDVVFGVLPLIIYIAISQYESKYNELKMYEKKCEEAKARRKKKRISWSSVCQRISDKQFRRMFRMTRECFAQLCSRIIRSVGEKNSNLNHILMHSLKEKIVCLKHMKRHVGGIFLAKQK